MEDIPFEKLRKFLLSKPKSRATNSAILELGLWNNLDEFRAWRKPYIQSGNLHLSRGYGGGLVSLTKEIPENKSEVEAKQLEGLSPDARKILELIPQDGLPIGNVRLRSKLGLSLDDYWKHRQELIQMKLIEKGKGRGGSVLRTTRGSEATSDLDTSLVNDEKELYEPLRKLVEKEYAEGAEYSYPLITAYLKGTSKKGKWSRPDVALVQVSDYPYLPTPVVEVTSFEVKTRDQASNLANVYESAAHGRYAHNCYLVLEANGKDDVVDSYVEDECRRHGVGIMKMFRDKDGYELDLYLEPQRQNPDSRELDEFLKKIFSQDAKEERKFKKEIKRG